MVMGTWFRSAEADRASWSDPSGVPSATSLSLEREGGEKAGTKLPASGSHSLEMSFQDGLPGVRRGLGGKSGGTDAESVDGIQTAMSWALSCPELTTPGAVAAPGPLAPDRQFFPKEGLGWERGRKYLLV